MLLGALSVLNPVDHVVQYFVRHSAGSGCVDLHDRVLDEAAQRDGQDERRNQDFRRVAQMGAP